MSLEPERAKQGTGSLLLAKELLKAEMAIVRYSRQKRFREEIAALSAGKSVSRGASICKLDPQLEKGRLRVACWLSKAASPEESKHPLILSKDEHMSTLILRHVHQQVGHSGSFG